MSSRTYVCFDCRTTERVPLGRIARNCRNCRKPAEHVYYKFKIPPKNDDTGWMELLLKVRPFNQKAATSSLAKLERDRAKIERQLEALVVGQEQKGKTLRFKLTLLEKQIQAWRTW